MRVDFDCPSLRFLAGSHGAPRVLDVRVAVTGVARVIRVGVHALQSTVHDATVFQGRLEGVCTTCAVTPSTGPKGCAPQHAKRARGLLFPPPSPPTDPPSPQAEGRISVGFVLDFAGAYVL